MDFYRFCQILNENMRNYRPEDDIAFVDKKSNYSENRRWIDTTFRDLRRGLPRTELYGWLSPRGKFISTNRAMNHLEAIKNNPELNALMPDDFKDSIAKLRHIEKNSEHAAETGEHPEWHRYEILSDQIEERAYDALYSRNYLRVATWRDEVHFEGTSNAIKNLYQKAKDLAEENGFDAKFQKIELATDAPYDI